VKVDSHPVLHLLPSKERKRFDDSLPRWESEKQQSVISLPLAWGRVREREKPKRYPPFYPLPSAEWRGTIPFHQRRVKRCKPSHPGLGPGEPGERSCSELKESWGWQVIAVDGGEENR
jgi:hypothetical protein